MSDVNRQVWHPPTSWHRLPVKSSSMHWITLQVFPVHQYSDKRECFRGLFYHTSVDFWDWLFHLWFYCPKSIRSFIWVKLVHTWLGRCSETSRHLFSWCSLLNLTDHGWQLEHNVWGKPLPYSLACLFYPPVCLLVCQSFTHTHTDHPLLPASSPTLGRVRTNPGSMKRRAS